MKNKLFLLCCLSISIGYSQLNEKQFKQSETMLLDDGKLTVELLSQCSNPCWILTSENNANELSVDVKIPRLLDQTANAKHFHITLIPFQGVPDPSDKCIAEQRLSLACLIPLSISEVRKKFKNPNIAYFFMRKYQDRDYFLFIQTEVR